MQPFSFINRERAINSLKTALACLICFFIAVFFRLPMAAWILITVIVVMGNQINLGGVIIKSSMQFIGSIAGALIAMIILLLYGDQVLPLTIVLFISITFFSYLATSRGVKSNIGLLGATTIIMILMSQSPTYKIAILRFAEISLAILVSFLVSKFIFPIHAYKKIYSSIAETLISYTHLYASVWEKENEDFFNEEEKIINIFSEQKQLIFEARNELSRKIASKLTYKKVLGSQREIFRYICLMHHAVHKTQFTTEQKQQILLFNQHIDYWFKQLVRALKEKNFKLECNLITSKELAPLIKSASETSTLASSQQLALDAFFFCAINLVREIRRLTRLIALMVSLKSK